MIKITKLQQVKLILLLAICILIVILFFVFSINSKNKKPVQSVTHSAEVIFKLDQIYSKMNHLESEQRGFILTGSQELLKSYYRIENETKVSVIELQQLVKNNRAQADNAMQLKLLIIQRLKALRAHMKNMDTDRILTTRILMIKVALKIQRMTEVEKKSIEKRLHYSETMIDKITYLIIVSVFFTCFFIVTATFILIREYRSKSEVEARLLYSEKQLREKVNELNASNMELEQFAYIASHDLQEPLRKIITFNDRINQRVSSALDDTTRDYLYRTTQAAERMKDLIEDLLNFSRVAKGNSEKSIVDLNSVIQAARENLELTSRNRNVIIAQHHALPKILGDKTQMIRLFQNLLSNAIKFVPKDKTPLVEIFCSVVPKEKMPQREEGYHAETYHKITVKDNGIGFANEFKEKIFVIFQRLHGRSEYEGTGIGLSICRKIVENHEGCIMASSVEGNGAEFYVYLPEVNP